MMDGEIAARHIATIYTKMHTENSLFVKIHAHFFDISTGTTLCP